MNPLVLLLLLAVILFDVVLLAGKLDEIPAYEIDDFYL